VTDTILRNLTTDSKDNEKKVTDTALSFAVTSHIAALAGPEEDDPVRRQFFPDPREGIVQAGDLEDPLGEAAYRVLPRLVHQYRDRALLKVTGNCAGHCRFCFRREWIKNPMPFISGEELDTVCRWLTSHSEIREILLSGGDPLTASDEQLARLFSALRAARKDMLLRLCTRVPITDPLRVNAEFISLCKTMKPLRLAVHINHPRELSAESRLVLSAFVEAGIPVHVQTVLLRGINDKAETLAILFRECLNLGLTPYYLFQLDLAPGTSHFRVPLRQGLAIYEELKSLVSGLGLPAYAVDLPGGGGKIRLNEGVIAGEKETEHGTMLLLKGPGGRLWDYPADVPPL
jgi:lysine 2,3-aminomutase